MCVVRGSIEEKVDRTRGINVPHFRAGIGSREECAGRKKPNGPYLSQTCSRSQPAIASAAGRADAGDDRFSSVAFNVGTIPLMAIV